MSNSAAAVQKVALPRLLMADDHHLILDALGAMMKDDFEIQTADNANALLSSIENFHPDAVVLDINMPGSDGFATARRILDLYPELPIIFLSMYVDSSFVEQAARLGAKAYLSKQVQAQELISAIYAVLEGQTLLDPKVISQTMATPRIKGELTARQREVLRLIAEGGSAKDVANKLNISVRTAEFHRAAIMQRLGLHSTAQMTRYAIANNIG